jgi:hypothetical protein
MKNKLLFSFVSIERKVFFNATLFGLIIWLTVVFCPGTVYSQQAINDSLGEAYFFHTTDYPRNGTPSWGDNKWAANGITHDDNNWYISSVNRDGLGLFTESTDWIIWRIPLNTSLDQDFDNNPNVIRWRQFYFNHPTDSRFKLYGHAGDIDHAKAKIGNQIIDFILVPLTSHDEYKDSIDIYGTHHQVFVRNGPPPAIAFFRADNLHFVNFLYLDSIRQKDIGWCAYKNDTLYTSNDDASSVFKYKIIWQNVINPVKHDALKLVKAHPIKNASSQSVTFRNMQGGEFSPSGDLLYINCGLVYGSNPEDGIHVLKFDGNSWNEIQRSTNRRDFPFSTNCFDYEFDNDPAFGDEPEGLTIWDLDNRNVPFAKGQLHVLLDHHNFFSSNKTTLKHFKNFKFPKDITVFSSTLNGEPSTNPAITSFYNHGNTYANCSDVFYSPYLNIFPPGKTPVRVSVTDHNKVRVQNTSTINIINKQDECSLATRIYACDKTIVDNYAASRSAGVPPFGCNTGTAKDVWFIVYPPSTVFSVETFQVAGGLTDLDMQAFSGTCGNLHEIACDDSSGDNRHAKIVFQNLSNSKPIYIRVTDHDGTHFGRFGIYTQKIATGTEIFTSTQFISGDGAGVHGYPTLTGDVNGDGKTDLIFTSHHQNGSGINISTKLSNGNGTYTSIPQVLEDGRGVHRYPTLTGDVNGDGKTDLIFQNSKGRDLNILTTLSNGNGTYTTVTQVFLREGAGAHPDPTLTGDVNGDGKTDLIFIFQHSNGSGLNIRTKLSNGDGTYTNVTQVLGDGGGVHQYPTLTGDVNGDGKTDLIFIFQHSNGSGLNIRTKLSNGDGNYTNVSQVLGDGGGVHQYPTLTGDVNGDGRTDLVFVFDYGSAGLTLRTKMANENGTFTAYQQILGDGTGVHDYPALTGDVDGDGKTDIIFTGQNWTTCGLNIRVKRSNGNGTWCPVWQGMGDGGGIHQYPTLPGDINADGKTDIIFVYDDDTRGLILRTKISQATNLCPSGGTTPLPLQGKEPFRIYPNPTNGVIQIAPEDNRPFELEVSDITGRMLFPKIRFSGSRQIDLTTYSNGIYLITLLDINANKKYAKKIVKMN